MRQRGGVKISVVKRYEVLVQSLGGFKFSAECRGHEVVSDLPMEDGGEDAGMKPPELLMASLGTCIGVYLAAFCKKHQISTEGMTITLIWTRTSATTGEIEIKMRIPTEVPENLKPVIIRVAEQCLIHKTLTHPPKMKFSLEET